MADVHEPITRRAELRAIRMIATPMAIAFLAEFIMFMVTKIVVGHVGYQELAAVGLAGDLAHEVLIILIGGLTVVGVLMAHAEGNDRSHEVGHALRQGLIVATIVGVVATWMILELDSVMIWTAQDPAIIALAQPYLSAIAWMVFPLLWFSVLRTFVAMRNLGAYVTVITIIAVGFNYFLATALVNGRFGLPNMGYVGAGWAMVIVTWTMFAALVAAIWSTSSLRGYGIFAGRLRYDPAVCAEISKLGLPVCIIVAIEAGLFAAVSLLSGYIGAIELAVYSVIIGWVGIPFVIAHGIAEASMIRVAFRVGTGRIDAARQAGLLSMGMGTIVIALLIVVPVGFPEMIVDIFLSRDDPGFEAVAALAGDLFLIAGLFQVFDGLQVIAAFSLRALRDTVIPVVLAGIGYWGLGIGGGALLAFEYGYGAVGLWWGLALGLFATAMMLLGRFLRLTRQTVRDAG